VELAHGHVLRVARRALEGPGQGVPELVAGLHPPPELGDEVPVELPDRQRSATAARAGRCAPARRESGSAALSGRP
jgi:hypothetical protein